MDNELSICSLNVRGLRDNSKHKKLFKFIKTLKYDIVILQETHSIQSDVKMWTLQWQGDCVFSHGTTNSRGVAVLIKPGNYITYSTMEIDNNGCYVILEISYYDIHCVLCGLYAPNNDCPEFFDEVIKIIRTSDCTDIIIGGDFNVVNDPNLDRKGCKENHPAAMEKLIHIKNTCDLVDIWHTMHLDKRQYTWSRKKSGSTKTTIAARLDYFLCSQNLHSRIVKVEHAAGYNTDHHMVVIHVLTGTPPRGRGFWKFNNTLLDNKTFFPNAEKVIHAATYKYRHSNPAIQFEMIKCEISSYSVSCAIMTKAARSNLIQHIQHKLTVLHNMNQEEMLEINDEIVTTQYQLDRILHESVLKHAFLSKTKWYSYGERNEKYFYSLAKSRYNNKTMRRVYNEDGKIVTDSNEILKLQAEYYERLYKMDKDVKFELVNKTSQKITSEQRDYLDAPLTLMELTTALNQFAVDKTPGCDGFTAEVYQALWPCIGELYHAAIMYAFEQHELHISACRGVLTLIPRKDKSTMYLKNWRPLTMLSMDYKVLAKALDNRLKSVLPDIIANTQTGFMSQRYILTNIVKLIQLMNYADAKKTQALVMLINFQKCFDSISHTAIEGSLRYFGVGQWFIDYVKLLFNNFELCTQNNGYSSHWICPQRGVHQGCLISPHLYNCCGQVFADLLQQNNQIDGITA